MLSYFALLQFISRLHYLGDKSGYCYRCKFLLIIEDTIMTLLIRDPSAYENTRYNHNQFGNNF